MSDVSLPSPTAHPRDLLFLTCPVLWPTWPFLPLVRRCRGRQELGVLFDARALSLTGYSATVFLTNLFTLPRTLDQLLALPKEVFDTAEEVARAGWGVD